MTNQKVAQFHTRFAWKNPIPIWWQFLPAASGWETGYALDKSPALCRTNIEDKQVCLKKIHLQTFECSLVN